MFPWFDQVRSDESQRVIELSGLGKETTCQRFGHVVATGKNVVAIWTWPPFSFVDLILQVLHEIFFTAWHVPASRGCSAVGPDVDHSCSHAGADWRCESSGQLLHED